VGESWRNELESFARRVLNVSFLGVSFLLSDRLGSGFGARLGGVHTGAGEKHDVRAGANLNAGTFKEDSGGEKLDAGRGNDGRSVAGYVAFVGSVLLLPKRGFRRC
jgi:hypothetical protein